LQDGELVAQDQDLRSLLRLVTPGQLKPRGDSRDQEKHDRRHMMGDHHGRAAERASPLVRATDEIFGTHRPSTGRRWIRFRERFATG